MLTEERRSKLSRRFSQLDANRDGYLDQGEIQTLAETLCEQLVEPEQAAEREDVIAGYQQLWRLLSQHADSDGDGRVSEDEYIDAMEAGVLADPQNYDSVVTRIVSALFRALDRDGSGALDLEELSRLCKQYEMSAADTQSLFDRLDANGDGTVSLDEFLGSVRDFFYSDDAESVGKYIFAGAS